MKSCETCGYSRTQHCNQMMHCYQEPPSREYSAPVNVTTRPAVCGKYRQETAREQFLDMVDMLEAMIPQSYNREAYNGNTGLIWNASHIRLVSCYNVFYMYQQKHYPITDKMVAFMKYFERLFPEHEAPELEAETNG